MHVTRRETRVTSAGRIKPAKVTIKCKEETSNVLETENLMMRLPHKARTLVVLQSNIHNHDAGSNSLTQIITHHLYCTTRAVLL
jgi:hypothetical protein